MHVGPYAGRWRLSDAALELSGRPDTHPRPPCTRATARESKREPAAPGRGGRRKRCQAGRGAQESQALQGVEGFPRSVAVLARRKHEPMSSCPALPRNDRQGRCANLESTSATPAAGSWDGGRGRGLAAVASFPSTGRWASRSAPGLSSTGLHRAPGEERHSTGSCCAGRGASLSPARLRRPRAHLLALPPPPDGWLAGGMDRATTRPPGYFLTRGLLLLLTYFLPASYLLLPPPTPRSSLLFPAIFPFPVTHWATGRHPYIPSRHHPPFPAPR